MLTKTDLTQIKKIVKTELEPVKKDLKIINGKLDTTIRFFDKEYLNLKARVDRMEKFLKIPPLSA